jgi:hypothetical protein
MKFYNNFQEMAAGTGSLSQESLNQLGRFDEQRTTNAPDFTFEGHRVDMCIERYGVTETANPSMEVDSDGQETDPTNQRNVPKIVSTKEEAKQKYGDPIGRGQQFWAVLPTGHPLRKMHTGNVSDDTQLYFTGKASGRDAHVEVVAEKPTGRELPQGWEKKLLNFG